MTPVEVELGGLFVSSVSIRFRYYPARCNDAVLRDFKSC